MAKFRFPGKALKLNTRKRVRFRGSFTGNTPEELYSRRIRKGLDLFTQLYGESDEDEDDFEGFVSTCQDPPEVWLLAGRAHPAVPDPPRGRAGKKAVAQKLEEACATLEEEGLVTRRRTSVVDMALREVGARKDTSDMSDVYDTRTGGNQGGELSLLETKAVVVDSTKCATQKHARHKLTKQPTVKTALAKKLLAKAKKKVPSLPVVGEKSPKRFILPTMSVRSSRIIKPNKRLFADFTDMVTSSTVCDNGDASSEVRDDSLSFSNKSLDKLPGRGRSSHKQFLSLPRSRSPGKSQGELEGGGRDRMRRSISLYTEAITGPCKGQVGRPPKRRLELPQPEVEPEAPLSPHHSDPNQSKVKEKIEKLLRSPWDNRLKQSVKGGKCEGDDVLGTPLCGTSQALSTSALSRNILRKARLNLNKSTLQKIRNPVSLQRLIPLCDEGSVEGKCNICDIAGGNSRKFNIVFCEVCSSFLSEASDGPRDVFECQRTKGGCQIQSLVEEDRCSACWLYRILTSCSMPNLLHDRLRKRLPPMLKDLIPTSLARSMDGGAQPNLEKDAELASHTKRLPLDPGGGGTFGSVMDLPGGWRRKTGPETMVISPSGEKFKSVQKLEEFLKKQGITTDARILFGNSTGTPSVASISESKSKSSQSSSGIGKAKVVSISLPGGWTRRIKWRVKGNKFDTFVESPDGRTFKSRKELSSYFQMIGKVDDIHKYFPVVSGYSDASMPSSSETLGYSSTEPISSSELCSEASDRSPEVSECEIEQMLPPAQVRGGKPKLSVIKQLKKMSKQQEGRPRTKSLCNTKTDDNDIEIEESSIKDGSCGVRSVERKLKKQKSVQRTRSLSSTRKGKQDVSLIDTTESESELKESSFEIIQSSPPLFSIVSPASDNKDGSSLLFSKEIHTSPIVSAKSVPVVCKKNTQDVGSKEIEEEKVDVAIDRVQSQESTKTSEEGLPLVKVNDIGIEKKDPKIVLKIPKKALKMKPVKKKKKRKGKRGPASKSKDANPDLYKIANDSELTNISDRVDTPISTNSLQESTQGLMFGQITDTDVKKAEEIPVIAPDVSTVTDLTEPAPSESEIEEPKVKISDPKPKLKKFLHYSIHRLSNGWMRKVKWRANGEGTVTLLRNPEGLSFRTRMDLLSYFKKSGESRVNMDYYYPVLLKKDADNLETETDKEGRIFYPEQYVRKKRGKKQISSSAQSSEISEVSDSDFIRTSDDSFLSGEESKWPRISRVVRDFKRSISQGDTLVDVCEENSVKKHMGIKKTITKSPGSSIHGFTEGRKQVSVPTKGGRGIVLSIKEIKPVTKSETDDVEPSPGEVGGPRVKHVCRSQAQVLGIPRAVFPSPKKEEEERINGSSPKETKKRKIVTITTTSSGKVLRKTMWCNKCKGCTTPNCQQCSNCLDMKKYGGKGTKKKPCVMRKCQNPRLANRPTKPTTKNSTKPNVALPTSASTTPVPPTSVGKENVCKKVPELKVPVIEEKLEEREDSAAEFLLGKSVFVPRQLKKPDQKDRGDIAAGKKFVPGALVNIDYWQDYDADEMILTGYPVTTTSPLHPQVLCFRCGSLGKEQLLYCAWCCEGIHPYCLEDGEGPENEAEEVMWICRRCAVCHVCGAPGADSLLRCSDCRSYFHLECLGPLAHSTCQPSPDRLWEADLWALLGKSWPHQPAIYDVRNFDLEGGKEDIVMHTELDPLRVVDEDCGEEETAPDIFFLPSSDTESIHDDPSDLIDLTFDIEIDDEEVDLDILENSICLEDSVVEVYKDPDLYKPEPSPTANPNGEEVVSMREDEYLYLGYKKECEYPTTKIEMSYYRLLQVIHNEHFDTLGYPTWREMKEKGLVKDRPTGTTNGSDTESASEGESESGSESDLDWEDIFEIRRHEAMQEMKERDSKKRALQRKKAEMEKEKARLEKQKELEREAREKELAARQKPQTTIDSPFIPKMKIVGSGEEVTSLDFLNKRRPGRPKKRRGRPPGAPNKPKFDDVPFVIYDEDSDYKGSLEPPKKKKRQPRNWEEFDRFFNRFSCTPTLDSSESRPHKVIHSDKGIVWNREKKSNNKKSKIKTKKVTFKGGLLNSRKNNTNVKRLNTKAKTNSIKGILKGSKNGKKLLKKKGNVYDDESLSKTKKLKNPKEIIISSDDESLSKTKKLKNSKEIIISSDDSSDDDDDSSSSSDDSEEDEDSNNGKRSEEDKKDSSDNSSEVSEESADSNAESDEPLALYINEDNSDSSVQADNKTVVMSQGCDISNRDKLNKPLKISINCMPDTSLVQESTNSDSANVSSVKCKDKVAGNSVLKLSLPRLPSTVHSQTSKTIQRKTEINGKENLQKYKSPVVKILENGVITLVRRPSKEGAETSRKEPGSTDGDVGTNGAKRPGGESDDQMMIHSKRTRPRHVGRASELASQRKAMLDY